MRGMAVVAFALMAMFLVAATGARAAATVTTYTVCGPYPTVDLTAAKQWVEGGILHVRGATFTEDLTGDLAGSVQATDSYNVDAATGGGNGFGTMSATFTGFGTFDGRFTVTFFPGLHETLAGQAILHGDHGLMTVSFAYPSDACGGGLVGHVSLLTTGA